MSRSPAPAATPPPYLAAVVQFEPTLFAKARNLAALLALTEQAAAAGAKLIVLPEMATVAYCWASRDEIAGEVEPIPGPTTDRFHALAARWNCWVVVGLAEVVPETGVYYNSAALIGPEGVVGRYRKTHAYISEPKWAKDGDLGLPVFATPLGRLTLSICMDATYPEAVRVPALLGADVVCFPTNWLSEKSPSPTWIARAAESGVYVLAANRHGLERGVQFSGGSAIIDPDGAIQAAIDTGDGLALGTIDIARARDKRLAPDRREDRFSDRRPDAYGTLTLSAYLWNSRHFHGLYDLRPLPAGRHSRAAVVQLAPVAGDPAANLERIETAVADQAAAGEGAELIVFPELAVSGPIADTATAARLAEAIPGAATERLARLAARHGVSLVVGMAEVDPTDPARRFNSAVVVGVEGVVGVYRKLHLTGADRAWATPGDRGLPTFDLPIGRLGLLVGYDALFPEAARVLALDGADLIACPCRVDWPAVAPWGATAVPMARHVAAGPTEDHFHLWRERARENNSYVLFANAAPEAGETAPPMGWSGIFGPGLEDEPRREALVRGTAPGAAALAIDTTELDLPYPTNVVRAKDLLGMRMPIWYDALQAPRGVDGATLYRPVARADNAPFEPSHRRSAIAR